MGFILIQKGVFKTKLKRDFKTGVENLIPFTIVPIYLVNNAHLAVCKRLREFKVKRFV